MKKFIICAAVVLFKSTVSLSQGCVAIRSINGFGPYIQDGKAFSVNNWQVNINNRYFKAFRDFKENHDQKTPGQNLSITKSYTAEVLITRILRNGWSASLSIPYLVNSRETNGEHGGPDTKRYTTHTSGVGDIRVTVYKWLIAPRVTQKFNIQAGLGIKFPTGDYKYQDNFFRNDSTYILAPVNPAIQLGDGGSGIAVELNAFYILNKKINFYANLFYMSNPREQNGASTLFGRTASALQVKTFNTVASVTDLYAYRAGVNFITGKWVFSGGLRNEGVPVKDLIGGSNGTRRAGYNFSAEPGISYRIKNIELFTYVPVIISREIKQNVPDKLAAQITGNYTLTQGGSGNYVLFWGIIFRLQ